MLRDFRLLIPGTVQQPSRCTTTEKRPRRCAKSQLVVVGGFDSRNLEYLDTSNTARGWAKLTEMPGPGMRYGMSGAGLAVHSPSGKIFVAGGVGKGAILQAAYLASRRSHVGACHSTLAPTNT